MREEGSPDMWTTCKSGKQDFDSRFLDEENGKHLAMKSGYQSKTCNKEESGLKDKFGVLQTPRKNEEKKM